MVQTGSISSLLLEFVTNDEKAKKKKKHLISVVSNFRGLKQMTSLCVFILVVI